MLKVSGRISARRYAGCTVIPFSMAKDPPLFVEAGGIKRAVPVRELPKPENKCAQVKSNLQEKEDTLPGQGAF